MHNVLLLTSLCELNTLCLSDYSIDISDMGFENGFDRKVNIERPDISVDVSREMIDSGIGQRMLDKMNARKHIPTNRPLKEGTTTADCQYKLNIRQYDLAKGDESQHVAITLLSPSSASQEMTHNGWTVGKVKDGELVFTPSFGANGDAPLTDDQKEIVRTLVSTALDVKVRNSDKIEY